MKNSFRLRLRTRSRKLRAYLLPVYPGLPDQLQTNFRHLYFDIGWFGILNGSALAFLTIYAARLGASTNQVGLINAMPAMISLGLAIPIGGWLERRPIVKSVLWGAIGQRIFYLLMALLPWIFADNQQVWILILFTFLMSIPGSIIAVGFNALFASAVPIRYRGMVASRRNAVFAVVTVVTSIFAGWILTVLPFPTGYQIVFGLGAVGGIASAIHLAFVKPVVDEDEALAVVPLIDPPKEALKRSQKIIDMVRRHLHTEALKGSFAKALLLLTFFHLVHYLSIPIFPVFTVNVLNLSDQTLSLGNALFYVTMFIGSTRVGDLAAKLGNKKLTGIGISMLGSYPFLLSFAVGPFLYYAASFFGGFAWSMVNVGMVNYLLEKVPANKRTGYLAWFAVGSNGAILAGTLLGPMIGNLTGLTLGLAIFGVLRMIAGFAILRWGD